MVLVLCDIDDIDRFYHCNKKDINKTQLVEFQYILPARKIKLGTLLVVVTTRIIA